MVGNTNEAAMLVSLLLFASSSPNICVSDCLLPPSPHKDFKGLTLDGILQILTPHNMIGNCLTFFSLFIFFLVGGSIDLCVCVRARYRDILQIHFAQSDAAPEKKKKKKLYRMTVGCQHADTIMPLMPLPCIMRRIID